MRTNKTVQSILLDRNFVDYHLVARIEMLAANNSPESLAKSSNVYSVTLKQDTSSFYDTDSVFQLGSTKKI
jgi:hypothetical protein